MMMMMITNKILADLLDWLSLPIMTYPILSIQKYMMIMMMMIFDDDDGDDN